MPVEFERRRPGFTPGLTVRLADGQTWHLAPCEGGPVDPERDGLLAAIDEAETRPEALLGLLALTICLLTRNYDLPAPELEALLSFGNDVEGREDLERAVGQLAAKARRSPSPDPAPGTAIPETGLRRFRRLWTPWTT